MNTKITTEFERYTVEKLLNLDSKFRRYWIVSDRIEDSEKHLVVFSYIGKNETVDERLVSKYRGYIMDIKNNKIIAKSYGMTDEMTLNEIEYDMSHMKDKALKYKAYEGVLLRVFKYLGQVYICTHRKLDFKLSIYRPGMTFKEMFESFDNENKIIETISSHLDSNDEVFYIFMVHPKLAVADTTCDKFGIYFFCRQSQTTWKVDYQFPEFLRNTPIIEQKQITWDETYDILKSHTNDVFGREKGTVLFVMNDKPIICMSDAYSFRKRILGEEQTLYPSFAKRVFEVKSTKMKEDQVYGVKREENQSYADYMFSIYQKICPESLKEMLYENTVPISEKYKKDYKETFEWIRKNPKSIVDFSKEGRISVVLAKRRMTQNFLTLEDWVEKNCTPDQFYTIVTDVKRSKHMYEKSIVETNKS